MSISETLLDNLSGYLDCLFESGCLSDEERNNLNELEDNLNDYICGLERELAELRGKNNETLD